MANEWPGQPAQGSSGIRVRRAVGSDTSALAEIGARTFRQAYAGYVSPKDLDGYVHSAFNPRRQETELTEPEGMVFVAVAGEDSRERLAGYAHLCQEEPPACVRGKQPIYLSRLYIDELWQGSGVGGLLLERCLKEARDHGYQTVWLGVLERNKRAQTFYKRHGFRDIGGGIFVMGQAHLSDRFMALVL